MGADPVTAGILGAATVGSSLLGKESAKDAAKAQKSSSDAAVQAQLQALQQMRLATEPFRFAGQQAINPLLQQLGLGQIGLPANPQFSMQTGRPSSEIEARLAELRARRAKLVG